MIEFILTIIYRIFASIFSQKYITFACNFERDIYSNLSLLYSEKSGDCRYKFLFHSRKTSFSLLREIFVISRSKILIVDCSHWLISKVFCSDKTKIIYIGHGGGCYKKMGFGKIVCCHKNDLKLRKLYGQFDYVLSTSESYDNLVAKNYGITEESILKAGLPRTDLLFIEPLINDRCIDKVILFAPTFVETLYGRGYSSAWDFSVLDQLAYEEGYQVIFSPHPDVKDSIKLPERWLTAVGKSYLEIIRMSSILITDRSSIMFDFSLFGKPIIIMDNDSYSNLWLRPSELKGVNIAKELLEIKQLLHNCKHLSSSKPLAEQQMSRCQGQSVFKITKFIQKVYFDEDTIPNDGGKGNTSR